MWYNNIYIDKEKCVKGSHTVRVIDIHIYKFTSRQETKNFFFTQKIFYNKILLVKRKNILDTVGNKKKCRLIQRVVWVKRI